MALYTPSDAQQRREGYEGLARSLLFLYEKQVMIRGACGVVIVHRECPGGCMSPHAGGTSDDWSEPHPTCPSLFVTPPCPPSCPVYI